LRYVWICGALCAVALFSWLLAGRRIVTLLDGVSLAVVERLGVERMVYESGTLELGGKHLDLTDRTFARVAEIALSSTGSVVLESGGRRFALGPGHTVPHAGNVPRVEFIKGEGDEVVFTGEQSRVAWPTPFDMNFMTGYSPSRRRNVYFRLRWSKPSGAKLEMLWRTEQAYYSRDGWLPFHVESITDGLMRVSIQGS